MTLEHIETAIIGAGQAGLATAYHLQQLGRPCLILDGNEHVGDNWHHPLGLAAALFASRVRLSAGAPVPATNGTTQPNTRSPTIWRRTPSGSNSPVRMHARVDRLEAADGKYVLQLGGDRIIADNVVVATGTFGRTPSIPDFAPDLDPSIRQLHLRQHRRPTKNSSLGRSLVVGPRHSGAPHRLQVATPIDDLGRPRPRSDAGTSGPLEHPADPSGLRLPWYPCDHSAYADRPQSHERDSIPRRTHVAGEAIRPASTRCGANSGPRDRCAQRTAGGRRTSARRCERGVVHRLPPSIRLDRPPGFRSRRLAAGDAGVVPRSLDCFSVGSLSSTRSARRCCRGWEGMPPTSRSRSTCELKGH